MHIALFIPCFVDQLYPGAAIAALGVLERLGVGVTVVKGVACCGQPMANAGFNEAATPLMTRFVERHTGFERIVVLSGSCAAHVIAHARAAGGEEIATRTTEFCAFLHDDIGVEAVARLGARYPRRVAAHIGCHGLRALGLARPTEIQRPQADKVRSLLHTVRGLELVELARPDECCGFGGTFAVGEPAVSAKTGNDRLRDYERHGAEAVVSTDLSCVAHLDGLARRAGAVLPMLHVAQVLTAT